MMPDISICKISSSSVQFVKPLAYWFFAPLFVSNSCSPLFLSLFILWLSMRRNTLLEKLQIKSTIIQKVEHLKCLFRWKYMTFQLPQFWWTIWRIGRYECNLNYLFLYLLPSLWLHLHSSDNIRCRSAFIRSLLSIQKRFMPNANALWFVWIHCMSLSMWMCVRCQG